jgi:hypothetical protein
MVEGTATIVSTPAATHTLAFSAPKPWAFRIPPVPASPITVWSLPVDCCPSRVPEAKKLSPLMPGIGPPMLPSARL